MGGLDPRGSRAGLGWAFSECPEMLLSGGTCSQHRGPLAQASWAQVPVPQPSLGPPDSSPPFPAPPSAPSLSMTARWRALSTTSSILGQAAPQRLAAASPAGGPTMWMQVWAPRGLTQSRGSPESLLPPQFIWRFSHCWWHCPASLASCSSRGGQTRPKEGAKARSGPVPEWAAERTAWWEESRGLRYPAAEAVASSSQPSQPRSLGLSLERLPGLMVFMI